MRGVWVYRATVFSRDGQYRFRAKLVMDEEAYAHESTRQAVEQKAEQELRRLEGVYPDMPITGEWLHEDWPDA